MFPISATQKSSLHLRSPPVGAPHRARMQASSHGVTGAGISNFRIYLIPGRRGHDRMGRPLRGSGSRRRSVSSLPLEGRSKSRQRFREGVSGTASRATTSIWAHRPRRCASGTDRWGIPPPEIRFATASRISIPDRVGDRLSPQGGGWAPHLRLVLRDASDLTLPHDGPYAHPTVKGPIGADLSRATSPPTPPAPPRSGPA